MPTHTHQHARTHKRRRKRKETQREGRGMIGNGVMESGMMLAGGACLTLAEFHLVRVGQRSVEGSEPKNPLCLDSNRRPGWGLGWSVDVRSP